MVARRIQTELRLFEQTEFSLATIHKGLTMANVKPLIKPKRSHVPPRFSGPIPGDRAPMDTMKIAPGVYQYTAVDGYSVAKHPPGKSLRSASATPLSEFVVAAFDESKERIRYSNWKKSKSWPRYTNRAGVRALLRPSAVSHLPFLS
jgi:hypothetical protein